MGGTNRNGKHKQASRRVNRTGIIICDEVGGVGLAAGYVVVGTNVCVDRLSFPSERHFERHCSTKFFRLRALQDKICYR